MAINKSLLIALRRNQQLRLGEGFIDRINSASGVELSRCHIVEPSESIEFEMAFSQVIESIRESGRMVHSGNLDWSAAQSILDTLAARHSTSDATVLLCHYPDFVFRLSFVEFVRRAHRIIEFDGDTAIVAGDRFHFGCIVDRYVDEVKGSVRYTVESWAGYELRYL